ncbi:hypothetical protein EF918_20740 [Streptomyces sp. WAC06614]|nr:hypothetical protein EF918_20740 [Streptomyces sp. WAC06614]
MLPPPITCPRHLSCARLIRPNVTPVPPGPGAARPPAAFPASPAASRPLPLPSGPSRWLTTALRWRCGPGSRILGGEGPPS